MPKTATMTKATKPSSRREELISARAAAKQLNCSVSTIHRWCVRLGLHSEWPNRNRMLHYTAVEKIRRARDTG